MNRYRNIIPIKTFLIKGKTTKPIYQTVIYPEIPLSNDDTYVYTTQGDRFDILAKQYYGDQSLWWIISIANTAVAGTSLPSDLPQDSLVIPEGTQIRIPSSPTEIINVYKNLNSL